MPIRFKYVEACVAVASVNVVVILVLLFRVIYLGSGAERIDREQRPLGEQGSMLDGNLHIVYTYSSWHFDDIIIFTLEY